MFRKWIQVVAICIVLLPNLAFAVEPLKLTIDTYPNLVFEVIYPQDVDQQEVIKDLDKVESILGQDMTKIAVSEKNSGALYGRPPRIDGRISYSLPLGEIVSVFERFAETECTVTVDTAIGWELAGDLDTVSHTVETKGTLNHYKYTGTTSQAWPTLGIDYSVERKGLVFFIVQIVLLCIAAPLVMYQGGTYVVDLVIQKRRHEDLKKMISWVSVASTLIEIGVIYLGFQIWHWIPVGTYFLGFNGAFLTSMGSVLVSMVLLMVAGYKVEKRAKKSGVL
ncbi:MAG: hypothetical protein PHV61_01575 [Limnochordia bacterium]|jgi:hypothetical protein|nr:hypothetical protein [Limnochordia bacterium]MDD2628852.1 hypothetical protein [Limnochordia bacterium]MDD4518785.1 hypothetical protein [Limnochordia bacterium]